MASNSPIKINEELLKELSYALEELGGWGSVEIYVQNNKVTQITKRAIKKTNHTLKSPLDKLWKICFTHSNYLNLLLILLFIWMVNFTKDSIFFKKFFPLLAIIVCFSFLGFYLGSRKTSKTSPPVSNTAEFAKPLAEAKLGQSFSFPNLDMTLVSARKVSVVANQGKPIKAGPNEAFLVLTLEFDNQTTYALRVNTQDFFRLQGEADKKFAPDFYNNTVEVPAISVRKDEVGFRVAADQNQFKLQIGEIKKEKQEVEINF